jgi:hypothetical protein
MAPGIAAPEGSTMRPEICPLEVCAWPHKLSPAKMYTIAKSLTKIFMSYYSSLFSGRAAYCVSR